jgi:hypothetical protein
VSHQHSGMHAGIAAPDDHVFSDQSIFQFQSPDGLTSQHHPGTGPLEGRGTGCGSRWRRGDGEKNKWEISPSSSTKWEISQKSSKQWESDQLLPPLVLVVHGRERNGVEKSTCVGNVPLTFGKLPN